MISLLEYNERSAKTAVYGDDKSYPILGLVSEVSEFCECSKSEKIKELGDIFWYIFEIARNFGVVDILIDRLDDCDDMIDETYILELACHICGYKKKMLRGDHNQDELKSDLICALLDLAECAAIYCENYDTCVEDVLEKNILKLEDRQRRDVLKGSGDNR